MIWFFSDPHYNHKNIVRGISTWSDKSGCRPFDTLEEHNDWVVQSINDKIGRNDTAYCLGDWSFGGKQSIKEFRDRVNCERVHLLLGNHDHHQQEHPELYGMMFDSISHYKEVHGLVLMHYPLESWSNMEKGAIHLHGHTHGALRVMKGRYDVGLDSLGPVSLADVALWPKPDQIRHATVEGGNKFGTR